MAAIRNCLPAYDDAPPSYAYAANDPAPFYTYPRCSPTPTLSLASDAESIKITFQLRRAGSVTSSREMGLGDILSEHTDVARMGPTTFWQMKCFLLHRARVQFDLPTPSAQTKFFVVLTLRVDGRNVIVSDANWPLVVQEIVTEATDTELVFMVSMLSPPPAGRPSGHIWSKVRKASLTMRGGFRAVPESA